MPIPIIQKGLLLGTAALRGGLHGGEQPAALVDSSSSEVLVPAQKVLKDQHLPKLQEEALKNLDYITSSGSKAKDEIVKKSNVWLTPSVETAIQIAGQQAGLVQHPPKFSSSNVLALNQKNHPQTIARDLAAQALVHGQQYNHSFNPAIPKISQIDVRLANREIQNKLNKGIAAFMSNLAGQSNRRLMLKSEGMIQDTAGAITNGDETHTDLITRDDIGAGNTGPTKPPVQFCEYNPAAAEESSGWAPDFKCKEDQDGCGFFAEQGKCEMWAPCCVWKGATSTRTSSSYAAPVTWTTTSAVAPQKMKFPPITLPAVIASSVPLLGYIAYLGLRKQLCGTGYNNYQLQAQAMNAGGNGMSNLPNTIMSPVQQPQNNNLLRGISMIDNINNRPHYANVQPQFPRQNLVQSRQHPVFMQGSQRGQSPLLRIS